MRSVTTHCSDQLQEKNIKKTPNPTYYMHPYKIFRHLTPVYVKQKSHI